VTNRSRATFDASFARQNALPVRTEDEPLNREGIRANWERLGRHFAYVQCHRHPCQKQPSTNTAISCLGKTKSGRTDTPERRTFNAELTTSNGIRHCLRQPLILFARSNFTNANSVFLFLLDRMRDMSCERVSPWKRERSSTIRTRIHGDDQ
jgi:hypothetical protein